MRPITFGTYLVFRITKKGMCIKSFEAACFVSLTTTKQNHSHIIIVYVKNHFELFKVYKFIPRHIYINL